MKKLVTKLFAYSAIAASAVILAGFTTSRTQAPKIITEPEDQMVCAGSEATLAVQANYGNHYQWLRNGVAVPGATKPDLTFAKIDIQDAGNYSCNISGGEKTVATRMASLMVYVHQHAASTAGGVSATPMQGGDQICLYAMPVMSSGSSSGCPGNFAGYVTFYKTVSQGWGWSPIANDSPYSAADGGGRSDTSILYLGKRADSGCDQTSVTIPAPTWSTAYRFTLYFPNNVPTTNYPIVLTGFNP